MPRTGDQHVRDRTRRVGWMLRSAGEVDRDRFPAFPDTHAPDLPRAADRRAAEELDPADRKRFAAMSR